MKFAKSITADLAERTFLLEIHYLVLFKSKGASYEIHRMNLGGNVEKFEFSTFEPVVAIIAFSLSRETRFTTSAVRRDH